MFFEASEIFETVAVYPNRNRGLRCTFSGQQCGEVRVFPQGVSECFSQLIGSRDQFEMCQFGKLLYARTEIGVSCAFAAL